VERDAVREGLATGTEGRPVAVPRRLPRVVREAAMVSKRHFLQQLHLEKRRSDRSGGPLSVVLLDIDLDRAGAVGEGRRLAHAVAQIKRDTDILGYLADDRIAVMLLDTDADGARSFLRNLAEHAEELRYRVTVATYPDQLFEHLTNGYEQPVESLFVEDATRHDPVGSAAKRAVDVVGAFFGLVLASPILLATAIAVKLSSPGPVIFRQQRLGKRGAPFTFYKFRSMRVDSDDRIHREYVARLIEGDLKAVNQGDAAQPHFKIKGDPRVTRVGRFIRRTSIDELPQLYNVLKGDMSLVGPRPPLPYEAEKYKSWHLRRVLEIRPGITGLWQVEGRNKTSFDDMVRLDLRYIRDWSPWLDLRILLKTIVVVLRGDGDA
jgi:exopolysaccharide biosynthesis polyprenyl glycosylphosphotransferase